MRSTSKRKGKGVSEAALALPLLSGRKKTLRLDQQLLDDARRALGSRTETDTVTRALEAVVRRELQAQGLGVLASLGAPDAKRIHD